MSTSSGMWDVVTRFHIGALHVRALSKAVCKVANIDQDDEELKSLTKALDQYDQPKPRQKPKKKAVKRKDPNADYQPEEEEEESREPSIVPTEPQAVPKLEDGDVKPNVQDHATRTELTGTEELAVDAQERLEPLDMSRFASLVDFSVSGRVYIPPYHRFKASERKTEFSRHEAEYKIVDWLAKRLQDEDVGEVTIDDCRALTTGKATPAFAVGFDTPLIDVNGAFRDGKTGHNVQEQLSALKSLGFSDTGDFRATLASLVNNPAAEGAFQVIATIRISTTGLEGGETYKPTGQLHKSLLEDTRHPEKPRLRVTVDLQAYVDKEKLFKLPRSLSEQVRKLFCELRPIRAADTSLDNLNLDSFYACLRPAPDFPASEYDKLQPAQMTANLLPFQKRTLALLLDRERRALEGKLDERDWDPEGVWEITELDGFAFAFSRLTGGVLPIDRKGKNAARDSTEEDTDRAWIRPNAHELGLPAIRGTLLCEEMGLGKTLETLALICQHPSPIESDPPFDPRECGLNSPVPIKATLIIAPAALFDQWLAELKRHAPSLKVITYDGWRTLYSGPLPKLESWLTEASKADVVLTTTNIAAADFDVAEEPPKRTRSDKAGISRERPQSALVLVQWWRVVMDEVQLVGLASTQKAARTIASIPRKLSLAISGTPARTQVRDLLGSLRFLGSDLPAKVWDRLLRSSFQDAFEGLFRKIAVRTTKDHVMGELTIPNQTRSIVPITLSRLEIDYYREALSKVLNYLEIDSEGFPKHENWKLDLVKLKTSLHMLRQICDHVSVGQSILASIDGAPRASHAAGRITSLAEALAAMQQSAENRYWEADYAWLRSCVRKALLAQVEAAEKPGEGLEFRAELLFRQVEKDIKISIEKLQALKEASATEELSDDDEDESSADGDPVQKVGSAAHRLRDYQLLQHEVVFRMGDYYHRFAKEGEPNPLEGQSYEKAVRLREPLLSAASQTVARSIERLQKFAVSKDALTDDRALDIVFSNLFGLRTQRFVEEWQNAVDILNENSGMVWDIRGQVWLILVEPVDENTDDPSGQEYDHFLTQQAKLEVLMSAYSFVLSDRRAFMTTERTIVVEEAVAPRKTQTALRAVQAAATADLGGTPVDVAEQDEDKTVDPEALLASMMAERNDLKSRAGKPLKQLFIDFKELAGIHAYAHTKEDVEIARRHMTHIGRDLEDQGALLDKLEREFKELNKAFNARIGYFKVFQTISDSVREFEAARSPIRNQIQEVSILIAQHMREAQLARARIQYLSTVAEGNDDEDVCVICRTDWSDIKQGVLLDCGHRYCQSCFNAIKLTNLINRCQVCRAPSQRSGYKMVSLEAAPKEEATLVKTPATAIAADPMVPNDGVNIIDPRSWSDIDILGSYGSKIDTLTKHIKNARAEKPQVKHLVFSAWNESLAQVREALEMNGIRCIAIKRKGDGSQQAFIEDDEIAVFLLHGEKESSGLTLTRASVVHLLEPVLKQAFELQAIGRVHRMGQTEQTQVFCYAAHQTVEAKIVLNHLEAGTSIYATGHVDLKTATVSASKKGSDDHATSQQMLDLIL